MLFAAALAVSACSPTTEQPAPSTDGSSTGSPTAPTTGTATASPTPTPVPPAEAPVATPVLARAVAAPVPVPATDGRTHLAYELLLTNAMDQDITVDSLQVRAGAAGESLLTLSGTDLAERTRILGTTAPTARLGPAQSALVWLDVSTDKYVVPTELDHQVQVTLTTPMPPLLPPQLTETVAPVTVQAREPVVIAPPLRGPQWWDANGCCGMTPHRMAINPIDGALWGAERYAIDYVQLLPDGRLFTGDVADTTSYAYFGADVHAVADGPVVAVLDGLPEQTPGKSPTGLRLDQYGGNHVVQDIGGGNYAFYAHLKTGSVAVKPGDRLSTGQVLGSLGNSGNTDAPHLHFHVMDSPDPLKADGLPFVFDNFRLTGRTDDRLGPDGDAIDTVQAGKPAPMVPDFTARDETRVAPLVSDVMDYSGE
ncbi:M23 family metallopeptidase [Mycolicibacterium neoaurum]|uniref:M23 family metallopeptidase n=1 Tax=Mycolicibacterium neoaurum TaxID=1795 RepID=UPI003AB98460